ncbi:Shikimate dehydrogenase (NADP(+)) [bacterium HR15]|nr:Shikimate dehydrogenase (NADP(+)) [bacterium HR15]
MDPTPNRTVPGEGIEADRYVCPDLRVRPDGIDAETQLVGVLGYPVRHSLSPLMHNAAFRHLGLNWVYLAFEVPPESLADAVRGMRALGIRGLNLTIPHKEASLALVDALTPAAQAIGAVNTLFWDEGRLIGDNTDAEGFLRAVRSAGCALGGMALVLGAGGAARAVVYALKSIGCPVVLANRTPERGRALGHALGVEQVLPLTQEALRPLMPQVQLVVNCTPVGMEPDIDTMPDVPLDALPSGAWVCDLVYRPVQTRLLRTAQQRGCLTIDGLGMLVYQGALAFERWTGIPAPLEIMREALVSSTTV